jgi:hypothetical protein
MDCHLPHRLWLLLISLSYFSISYLSTAYLSANSLSITDYKTGLDDYQIFIDWMIIPYSTSILFYCYSLIATKNRIDLCILFAKLSWAVFIASTFFLLFPAKFSYTTPAIDNEVFLRIYALLHTIDNPYNQVPSLHVIFCVIFYNEFSKLVRHQTMLFAIRSWLLLIIISTWFTFQHHSIDIFTGLIVGIGINFLITKPQHYVASIYLMISGLSLIIANSMQDKSLLITVLCCYLWLSFALISIQYQRNNAQFLIKSKSKFNFFTWILYAPYILSYQLLWLVNYYKLEGHKLSYEGVTTKVSDTLLVGPRLSTYHLEQLPANSVFIDLSAEVAESSAINQNRYRYFPMLDLQAPHSSQIIPAVRAVHSHNKNNQTVYLHCAMGYSRSFLIACIYLIAYKNYSSAEAKNYLLSLNNLIILPEYYVSNNDLLLIAKDCIALDAKQAIHE